MANEDDVLTITDGWGADVSLRFRKDGWFTLTATILAGNNALLSPREARELRDFLTAKLEGNDGASN